MSSDSPVDATIWVLTCCRVLFDLRLTKEQWISVLKLSTRWDMAKVSDYSALKGWSSNCIRCEFWLSQS